MSYQFNSHNFPNTIPLIVPDAYPAYSKHYSNPNYNQPPQRQNKSYLYDYEMQKGFISKEKQWLNSIKNPQSHIVHNVIGNTITKPNSSSLAQQKRTKADSSFEFEQNLAKTVKHSAINYKKLQPQINPEHFKASSIYGQSPRTIQQSQNIESRASKFVSSNNEASQKHSIMSIDQIREVEKKQFSQKPIHKITSSASSRNKLKSSSSKDSKGSSVNIGSKSIKLNGHTQRYNKYINSELININIDLRKETPDNIIAPNLNVRRFGGSEPLQNQYQNGKLENYLAKSKPINQSSQVFSTSYANYASSVVNPVPVQSKYPQNEQLTCRDSIPREDKDLPHRIKTRSKSNLSRYSQLKQQHPNNECLVHCDQKMDLSHRRQIEIVMHQTAEKSLKRESLPQQKLQKKINFISYSSIDKNPSKTSEINPNSNLNYQTEFSAHKEFSAHRVSKESKREEVQKIPISFSGLKVSQQQRRDRPQTQRKSITNFNIYPRSDVEGESNGLSQLIQEKMKKKPIRLTLQKRN